MDRRSPRGLRLASPRSSTGRISIDRRPLRNLLLMGDNTELFYRQARGLLQIEDHPEAFYTQGNSQRSSMDRKPPRGLLQMGDFPEVSYRLTSPRSTLGRISIDRRPLRNRLLYRRQHIVFLQIIDHPEAFLRQETSQRSFIERRPHRDLKYVGDFLEVFYRQETSQEYSMDKGPPRDLL